MCLIRLYYISNQFKRISFIKGCRNWRQWKYQSTLYCIQIRYHELYLWFQRKCYLKQHFVPLLWGHWNYSSYSKIRKTSHPFHTQFIDSNYTSWKGGSQIHFGRLVIIILYLYQDINSGSPGVFFDKIFLWEMKLFCLENIKQCSSNYSQWTD